MRRFLVTCGMLAGLACGGARQANPTLVYPDGSVLGLSPDSAYQLAGPVLRRLGFDIRFTVPESRRVATEWRLFPMTDVRSWLTCDPVWIGNVQTSGGNTRDPRDLLDSIHVRLDAIVMAAPAGSRVAAAIDARGRYRAGAGGGVSGEARCEASGAFDDELAALMANF